MSCRMLCQLWRLPASVRSLTLSSCRRHSSVPPSRASEPLRILFCGSDHFSIASLRGLAEAKRTRPGLIHSIDVLHRPAKRTGRGLKIKTEVPIQRVATEELQLDTHVTDTFTGWSPPAPFDLVIAVSFGLFVPPRILSHAKYGGLNVHPSLLPDLRGPAPIEHALLQQRKRTGVSIQTLHPVHFDHGTILAQTPAPGLLISSGTTKAALEIQLAKIGAKMLVDVLSSRSYVPPHQDSGWYASRSNASVNYAPKITKQDSFVDFEKHTKEEIMVKQRALGETWCLLPNGDRLIMHHLCHDDGGDTSSGPLGIWTSNNQANPLFRAANGRVGQIRLSTYEGGKVGCGNAKLLRMFPPQKELGDEDEIHRLSSLAADDDGWQKSLLDCPP